MTTKVTVLFDQDATQTPIAEVITEPIPVAKVQGIRVGQQTGAVGATWKKLYFNEIAFDYFPLYNATVRTVVHTNGVPNGNFILQADGVYNFKAQIYPAPPQSPSAKVSMYLGLTDRGPSGTGTALLHVANMEFPGGQHPALSLDVMVQNVGVRYYSFDWYFMDGAGVTPALDLQTAPIYTWATVQRVQ